MNFLKVSTTIRSKNIKELRRSTRHFFKHNNNKTRCLIQFLSKVTSSLLTRLTYRFHHYHVYSLIYCHHHLSIFGIRLELPGISYFSYSTVSTYQVSNFQKLDVFTYNQRVMFVHFVILNQNYVQFRTYIWRSSTSTFIKLRTAIDRLSY